MVVAFCWKCDMRGLLGLVLAVLRELAGGELGPPALGRLRVGRYGDHALDETVRDGSFVHASKNVNAEGIVVLVVTAA
jgi:hypothetical protein